MRLKDADAGGQTVQSLIRVPLKEQSDLALHSLIRPICFNIQNLQYIFMKLWLYGPSGSTEKCVKMLTFGFRFILFFTPKGSLGRM